MVCRGGQRWKTIAKVLLKFGETERELNNERMSLNEDFNEESFKMLAWHRFVLWQQIIQSEPKRIRDSGGVQSVLMDIVEQQQKEWDELKNKYV